LLKDEAATWHSHQSLVLGKEYNTGAELLEDLLLWARPKYNQQTLRDKLAELKQTSSVDEYIAEFQNLSMLIEGLSKEEAFDRFQRGLFSQIRQEVLKLDTINLEKAFKCASNIGGLQKFKQKGFSHNSTTTANFRKPYENRGTPMEVDNLEKKKRYPLREAEARKILANNGCLYCRKENAGHTKDNCPEKLGRFTKKSENQAHEVDQLSTEEYDSEGYSDSNVGEGISKLPTRNRENNNFYNKNIISNHLFESASFESKQIAKNNSVTKGFKHESSIPLNKTISRSNLDANDWQLNPKVAQTIFKAWGVPTVDLFASSRNKQAHF
jgi:hypothetical protein